MASEANSSILAPPFCLITLSTTQAASKPSRSPIIKHLRDPEEGEPRRDNSGQKLYYYLHCKEYKTNTITNLKRHLLLGHSIEVKASTSLIKANATKILYELWEKVYIKADISKFKQIILRKHLNRDIIITALLNFIIVLNLSFQIIKREEFYLLY
jgi:hypothetical protein